MTVLGLAGCSPERRTDLPSGAVSPETGESLRYRMNVVQTADGGLPREIRLSVENMTERSMVFNVPAPICPKAQNDTQRWRGPALQITIRNERGLEAGGPFSSVLSDPQTETVPPATSALIQPGATWTQTYRLSEFFAYDEDGTARSFPDLVHVGPAICVMHLTVVSPAGAYWETNGIPLRCDLPDEAFREYNEAEQTATAVTPIST